MVWSINITDEGWAEIELEIRKMKRSAVMMALLDDRAEMVGQNADDVHVFRAVSAEFNRLRWLESDTLDGLCLDRVRENDTCSNGGWEYYIDREGYHTIALSDESRDIVDIQADLATAELEPETDAEFRKAMAEYLRGWFRLARTQRWRNGDGPKPE